MYSEVIKGVKIPAIIQFPGLDYNYQSLKADDIDIDFIAKTCKLA